MARIPEDEVERLKREVSLERLVSGSGVELRPHGKDLVGRCPFHDDREPSLVVTPAKNLLKEIHAATHPGARLVRRETGVGRRENQTGDPDQTGDGSLGTGESGQTGDGSLETGDPPGLPSTPGSRLPTPIFADELLSLLAAEAAEEDLSEDD